MARGAFGARKNLSELGGALKEVGKDKKIGQLVKEAKEGWGKKFKGLKRAEFVE